MVYAWRVWKAITEFVLQLHSQGLGHEAVIEIMIALLGLMLGVLTLIAGLFATVIAIIGWFGFTAIREEAVKRAEQTALGTATRIAGESLNQMWSQSQASGMSESQSEPETKPDSAASPTVGHIPKRRKAMSDKNLKEGDDE